MVTYPEGARGLQFGLSLYLHPFSVYASSEYSGESASKCSFVTGESVNLSKQDAPCSDVARTRKVTHIIGRLLDHGVILFNCAPFRNGNFS